MTSGESHSVISDHFLQCIRLQMSHPGVTPAWWMFISFIYGIKFRFETFPPVHSVENDKKIIAWPRYPYYLDKENVTRYKFMLLRVFSSMQKRVRNRIKYLFLQVGYVLSMFLTSGSVSALTYSYKKRFLNIEGKSVRQQRRHEITIINVTKR